MESRKTVGNQIGFPSDRVATRNPEENSPPFEDEQRRNEFVASIQLRCENILKQVRLSSRTSGVTSTASKDSVESSASNLTAVKSLSLPAKKPHKSLELIAAECSQISDQSIKDHINRITEMLRPYNVLQKAETPNIKPEDSATCSVAQKPEDSSRCGIAEQLKQLRRLRLEQTEKMLCKARKTSDGKYSSPSLYKNTDEKTQRITSHSATEEGTAEAQANTQIVKCCGGVKHAPDSENVDEGEILSECKQGSREAENVTGDLVLIRNSYAEEKLGFPEKTSDIINEALFWRRKTVADNEESALACSNQTEETKKPKDDNSTTVGLKRKYWSTEHSTKDENHHERMTEIMAKEIVQDVFDSIGCYENFVRRADWVDEPSSAPRDLVTIPVAYSFADPYEKISEKEERRQSISGVTSDQIKQDDNHLPNSEVTCDFTKQDDGQLSTSEVSCDKTKQDDGQLSTSEVSCDKTKQGDGQLTTSEVTFTRTDDVDTVAPVTPNTAGPITETIGEPSATGTAPDVRNASQKRHLLKRGRKRWYELRKRRPTFVVGKKVNIRIGARKGPTSQQRATEVTTNSEVSEEDTCRLIVDEEKLAPLKEFIVLGDIKTKEGEDVVVLNPSKIPSKREFTGKKEYDDVMDCLFLHAQKFTEEKVESDSFVLTVHAVKERRSRLRSRKWAMEFYKFLEQRYNDRLIRCVLFKPSLKLRALVALSRPFISNCMKEKIYIVKSRRDFAKAQGLPESVPCL